VRRVEVVIHEIATDGLPPRENGSLADSMTGRVAFIWDGTLVTGWPLYDGEVSDGPNYTGLWEVSDDALRGSPVLSGVTHWVELPEPVWGLVT
jgi:hypothetical protein